MQITDAGLRHLAPHFRLTHLDLSYCLQLTDDGLDHIRGERILSARSFELRKACKILLSWAGGRLGSCTLQGVHIWEVHHDFCKFRAGFGRFPGLYSRLHDEVELAMLCYAGLTNLRALSLEGCEELRQVSALASMHKLRTLNLMRCTAITGLHHLAGELLHLRLWLSISQNAPARVSPGQAASRRQSSPGLAGQYSPVMKVMGLLRSC